MGKLKIFTIAGLAGLCGLIFFARLHTYDEPLERDITTYAVIGHELLAGKSLYSDLWDHKPPAIHVTFAAAEFIAGYGRDSIFLMNVAAAIATLVACYLAGSAAGGGRIGGLVAAGLWTVVSGDLGLEGNQPNTEVFLNTLLTFAFAILVRSEKNSIGIGRALVVGLLFAAASLYKQIVVVQAALLAIAYLACAEKSWRKQALVEIMIIASVGAAAWTIVFGYFISQGRLQAFTDAIFSYNRWYASRVPRSLNCAWNWPGLSPHALTVMLWLGALPVAGMIAGLIFGPRRGWILLLAFAIATDIAVLLPGWFFPHYYQLWLPPVVIGAGWAVALGKRTLPQRFAWSSYALAGVCCAVLVMMEIPCYLAPAKSWSMQKYGGIFLESEQLATRIDNLLPPGASFYEWGNETGFYFTTRREPLSGLIFAYPMQAGPLAPKLSWRLLNDLRHRAPELVVAANLTMSLTPDHPVARWIDQNYRPLWRTNSFVVMVRKGGDLDRQNPIAAN